MKILVSSNRFAPEIGGIETCTELLAREWIKVGHQVTILTTSKSENPEVDDKGFRVFRNPSPWILLKLLEEADVYFHNNISLKTAWPLILIQKPWFVTTEIWIQGVNGEIRIRDRLKRWIIGLASNIHISKAMKDHVTKPGPIVGNPYDRQKFRVMDGVKRSKDLVFLGRLVSDKGCDVLIDALKNLKEHKQHTPTLSIIGDGEEKSRLEEQVAIAGLSDTVQFLGFLTHQELVRKLNEHKIQVIPSLWEEPFGISALEGMASGCSIIAAQSGGLREVVKDAGLTYPKSDSSALAECIDRLLEDEALRSALRKKSLNILEQYDPTRVANHYLSHFKQHIDPPISLVV